jgi:hypothetical protein
MRTDGTLIKQQRLSEAERLDCPLLKRGSQFGISK